MWFHVVSRFVTACHEFSLIAEYLQTILSLFYVVSFVQNMEEYKYGNTNENMGDGDHVRLQNPISLLVGETSSLCAYVEPYTPTVLTIVYFLKN